MLIRISVIQFCGGAPVVNQAYIFDENGGSIGREDENQLVLRDESRVLSRVQARIAFDHDHFVLDDNGGNPSLVNGLRVGRGNRRPIYDGDIIEMGDYKMRAKVIGGAEGHVTPAPPAAPVEVVANDHHADSDASLHIELDGDFEFDAVSTIVTALDLEPVEAPEPEPEPAPVPPAAPAMPTAPQLAAALCKGLALGSFETLPRALDPDCMQGIGRLLSFTLQKCIDRLTEHGAMETVNSVVFQTLFLRTLQDECARLYAARTAPPPSEAP
ncbi:MAG: FHA domain-containing protein [Rhodocyclaceae bacterium]